MMHECNKGNEMKQFEILLFCEYKLSKCVGPLQMLAGAGLKKSNSPETLCIAFFVFVLFFD